MTELQNESKHRDHIFFGLLTLLYIIFMLFQTIFPILVEPNPQAEFNMTKAYIISCGGIFIGLFQFLLCLEFVTLFRKPGLIAQFVLNGLNLLCIFYLLFFHDRMYTIPNIAISLVACIVCWVMYGQVSRIYSNMKTLHRLAFTDSLTGLPNRNAQISEIERCIIGPNKENIFSLIMFDFDNFKMINEFLGHQIGDVLLVETIHNIERNISRDAKIGRVGDDRFLVILYGTRTDKEIEEYIDSLNRLIKTPFHFKGHDYRMTACMGVARYPKDSDTTSELMRQVEIAMFRAKSYGKDRVVFFDEKMQTTLERHMQIERKLNNAIVNKELYLEYQPQYHIPDRTLRGFEVLCRWDSPTLGTVPPSDFIPLAEENGSIIEIGKWIMREACYQFMKIYKDEKNPPMLSINISVVQFRDPTFLQIVKDVLADTGINPDFLEFEITESVCINSQENAKAILESLKKMGIRLSLDDFGTGYSSLSYLRTLPLDVVKIDKSFIDTIGVVPDEKNIVKTIINMAHQLSLEVVSEGIEQVHQYDYLVKNGCDYIQGNYLGKPLPSAAL